jgi:hypothetical protein
VVRRKQAPSEIETVALPEGVVKDGAIRVDKLLARIGLAESVTDAARKDQGRSGGDQRRKSGRRWLPDPPELLIQVGKNWRKVIR